MSGSPAEITDTFWTELCLFDECGDKRETKRRERSATRQTETREKLQLDRGIGTEFTGFEFKKSVQIFYNMLCLRP